MLLIYFTRYECNIIVRLLWLICCTSFSTLFHFCVCQITYIRSDHDITNTKEQQEQNEVNGISGSGSPSLAQLVGGKSDGSPTTTSGRSNAAVNNSNNDAMLGEGNVSVDLKALLPTQKMKFMKLDVSLLYIT